MEKIRKINQEKLELNKPQLVEVTNIKMPFWSMVTFMIKWAIATIPALIILCLLGILLLIIFGKLALQIVF